MRSAIKDRGLHLLATAIYARPQHSHSQSQSVHPQHLQSSFATFITSLSMARAPTVATCAEDGEINGHLRLSGSDVGATDLAVNARHRLGGVDLELGILKSRLD